MIINNYLTVPINIYQGEVEIKSRIDLHPLHTLILQLAVVENDLEKVINAFGLNAKLIQEAIIDLIYKELVYVDFENSLIFPSIEVETAIDRGRLDSFLGNEFPEKTSLKWIQDTATGQVFMYDDAVNYFYKPQNLTSENQIKLSRIDFAKINELNTKSLIKIAKIALRPKISEGDIFESVNRISDLTLVDSRAIYIPLEKKKLSKDDLGTLYPVSKTLPSNTVDKWMRSITELDSYSISDLSPVEEDYLLKYNWLGIITNLSEITNSISQLFNKSTSKLAKKVALQTTAKKIEQEGLQKLLPQLIEMSNYFCKTEIDFYKGNEILEKLQKTINQTEKLLVIGSSFINDVGMSKIVPILEKLKGKEVKVILIWGMLGNPLSKLKQMYPIFEEDWIKFVKSETKFHSKFLIIDNNSAWITSCNLFSYWYESSSPFEMICEIRNSNVIGDIIEYARSKIGGNRDEIKWFNLLSQNNLNEFQQSSDIQKLISDFKEKLTELKEKCEIHFRSPSNRELTNELRITFDTVNSLKRKLLKFQTGILVENLEHRKLLRSVLTNSRKSVKIGTDRILEQAVGPVIISAFNNALNNKKKVEVIWGKETPDTISKKALSEYQYLINNIQSKVENRLKIPDRPSQSHSKYMTMDDDFLVVTSYNLLAFSGDGKEDDDITDELGIAISSKGINKKLFG